MFDVQCATSEQLWSVYFVRLGRRQAMGAILVLGAAREDAECRFEGMPKRSPLTRARVKDLEKRYVLNRRRG